MFFENREGQRTGAAAGAGSGLWVGFEEFGPALSKQTPEQKLLVPWRPMHKIEKAVPLKLQFMEGGGAL